MPDYPKPNLTVDCVVRWEDEVLLIRRGKEPFAGSWALPGGFVNEGEDLEAAARRELFEETGIVPISGAYIIGAFGRAGRDPRGWTVSVAYYIPFYCKKRPEAFGADDALEAQWFPLSELPSLAFDHAEIIDSV